MIKNIGWTLGNDCPCKCKHCYSFSVRQKGKNLTKEIVDKVIERIEKLNVETVNLGGNEPIFTNGLDVKKSMLPYILNELNKRNIKVGITTAGISLISLKNTYPECLELLNDVDISLDSPFEKEHNENRGGDVYKYAIQALEICKEYNIEAGIIMCAMNWNFTKDRIDALLEIAKKYDSNIRFNLLKPIQQQHFKLVPSNDEFLQECLNENSEARLKNIISTIQSEQNKIIRAKMSKPLIVQGVAGSGKTTVALHRIAYLVYTYEKEFNPDEFLIIAPNKFFLDYISNVLPDLGVDYVRQQTFEEFMFENIEGNIEIEPVNTELSNIVNKNGDIDLIKESASFKSSLIFKDIVDEFISDFLNNNLPKEDFKVTDIIIFTNEEIRTMFMELFKNNSVNDSKRILSATLQKRLSNVSDELIDRLTNARKKKIDEIDKNLDEEEIKKIRLNIFKETEYDIQQLFKGGKKLVQDYLKNFKIEKALTLYKKLINKKEFFEKYISDDLYMYILDNFKRNIKLKKIEYEDLTPLFYLQNKFLGNINNLKLKHIVIDEAQDLGEFQFYIFKEILHPNVSMTILGDIAQGIYSYKGTNNWKKLNQNVFDNQASIEVLKESYRTSMEIMNEANTIINKIADNENIILAQPIERHGDEVQHWKVDSENNKIIKICEIIKKQLERGHINIAIITKDFNESLELHREITNYGVNVELISENLDKYTGGVIVIPSYLSKGLEFDSVIISDSNKYSENILDTKLLYVACTRAMHTLDIISK